MPVDLLLLESFRLQPNPDLENSYILPTIELAPIGTNLPHLKFLPTLSAR